VADVVDPAEAARDRAVRQVCDALGIDRPDAPEALGEAYDVVRRHVAPFVVKHALEMLADHRADVEANPDRRIVFLGRDAHSLAAVTRAVDPEFFDRSCSEVVLSRAVAEAAVQDLEVNAGMSFPELRGFRGAASKVDPADVQGARMRLADYLQNNGVPVGRPGSEVTLVDTSYKGTVQELLAFAFPVTRFDGRYLFHGQSPDDPHPGSKKGYALHLDTDRSDGGVPSDQLDDDPALTFAHQDAVAVIEDLLHGPMTSPRRIGQDGGPEQTRTPPPLDGLNPLRVAEPFTDPKVREGVMDIALHAVTDYARHVATLQDTGRDWRPELDLGAERFRDEIRAWIGGQPTDPHVARVLDSFVRRSDKATVRELAEVLDGVGLEPHTVAEVWREYDRCADRQARKQFVDQIRTEYTRRNEDTDHG
jgi:hypothetical protein